MQTGDGSGHAEQLLQCEDVLQTTARTLSGHVLCGVAHLQSWAVDPGVGLNPDGHAIIWLMVQEWHGVRVRSTVELEQTF